MHRADLSFQEIYNNLLAGKKLVLHFSAAGEAETFRTRLHHHKTRQQELMVKLGLMNEDEKTVLRFKVQPGNEGEGVVSYVQFALPSPLKKYPVVIVEEDDIKKAQENAASVSTAVG